MQDTKERLKGVFFSALDLEPDVDVESLERSQCDEWDSLHHMTLVVALEDEFDVEFTASRVLEMETFESALKVLRDLGVTV